MEVTVPSDRHVEFSRPSPPIAVATLVPSRIMDEATTLIIARDLREEVGCITLIVDFQNVIYIDNSFRGKLTILLDALVRENGRLILCNLCPNIRETLEGQHLDCVFEIVDTLEEALAKACNRDVA